MWMARWPYSYFNGRGDLVGFDVEMACALAGKLGLEIEFVPVPRERLAEVINAGLCDVIMGGIAVTTGRASEMVFSPPYIDETFSFVVPDHRRADFLQRGVDPCYSGPPGCCSRLALSRGDRSPGVRAGGDCAGISW
jgi:Bacterial extracellular solute-binding proteins, family 3